MSLSAAPLLTTERLTLRAHRREDYGHCLALWQHPETVRFIGGQPQGDQAVWFRLLRYGGFWPLLGYGFWVFEDKVTGEYLGEGGLFEARRGIDRLDGQPEVGWALMPQAGGRGLATEAIRAVLGWADAHLAAPSTACIIAPQNKPSLRVAAKLGFAEVDRPALEGQPIILLERPRAQAASVAASL